MPYRQQIAVQRAEEKVFSYYECVDSHVDCPVCEERVYHSYGTPSRRECFPERRARLSGWWFWAKMCPLGGSHDHYKCSKCNTVWICFHQKKQPSEKIHV